MKNDLLVPDWATYMTRAEQALKRAEKAFLLHDYDHGVNDLGECQENINALAGWLIRRETLERIK